MNSVSSSSLLRYHASSSSMRQRTYALGPATYKRDLKGSSTARISSSAALK